MEIKGLLVDEKRLTRKGVKKMMITIGASRRMKHEKRKVPYFRYLGCVESRKSTVYEGALAYEHGPHGDEAEAEN